MKKKMIDKKKKILYTKVIILIVCIFLILKIFNLALSRYESSAIGNANVDIAFYVLKEDYMQMTLNLDSIIPKSEPYVYTFSIGNIDGENLADVDLEYDLTIRTTTNLPLSYNLFMNEEYNSSGATSIITAQSVDQDEDGTYFRTINTDSVTLRYTTSTTNIYQLVVYFPETYNKETYQDIIEMIEITVDGKQITE